jgi:hypothetical protein
MQEKRMLHGTSSYSIQNFKYLCGIPSPLKLSSFMSAKQRALANKDCKVSLADNASMNFKEALTDLKNEEEVVEAESKTSPLLPNSWT